MLASFVPASDTCFVLDEKRTLIKLFFNFLAVVLSSFFGAFVRLLRNLLGRKSKVGPHRALAELENVARYRGAAVAEQTLQHRQYHQLQASTVHLHS